eukprot:scaffold648018_cov48-Prasinocladus_malaysianus.AAC.1
MGYDGKQATLEFKVELNRRELAACRQQLTCIIIQVAVIQKYLSVLQIRFVPALDTSYDDSRLQVRPPTSTDSFCLSLIAVDLIRIKLRHCGP